MNISVNTVRTRFWLILSEYALEFLSNILVKIERYSLRRKICRAPLEYIQNLECRAQAIKISDFLYIEYCFTLFQDFIFGVFLCFWPRRVRLQTGHTFG